MILITKQTFDFSAVLPRFYSPTQTDATTATSPKSDLSFQEKVALQGKPRLGDVKKVQIRIKESKEFKASFGPVP